MNFQWRKEWTAPATVGVVGFAAGAAAGYFYAQRKLGFNVEETVTAVLERTDDIVTTVEVPLVDDEQSKILRDFVDAINELKEKKPVIEQVGSPKKDFTGYETITNLPTGDGREIPVAEDVEGWDYEEEVENRTPDAPYVIHRDEFFNRESGLHQSTLSWYEGDKILADENDVPVYAPEKVVGVLRWGHGSGDDTVVYIRNDKLSAEYEVVKNPGSYQTEILGLDAQEEADQNDLKHSKVIPRFRMD